MAVIRYHALLFLPFLFVPLGFWGFPRDWRYSPPHTHTHTSAQSLRASVSSSRTGWQGLTLVVTTDGTFDRYRCLCVHPSLWEDSSKHCSTSLVLPTAVTPPPPFIRRDLNTWHTHPTGRTSWIRDCLSLLISHRPFSETARASKLLSHPCACVCLSVCGQTLGGNTCYLGKAYLCVCVFSYLTCSRHVYF